MRSAEPAKNGSRTTRRRREPRRAGGIYDGGGRKRRFGSNHRSRRGFPAPCQLRGGRKPPWRPSRPGLRKENRIFSRFSLRDRAVCDTDIQAFVSITLHPSEDRRSIRLVRGGHRAEAHATPNDLDGTQTHFIGGVIRTHTLLIRPSLCYAAILVRQWVVERANAFALLRRSAAYCPAFDRASRLLSPSEHSAYSGIVGAGGAGEAAGRAGPGTGGRMADDPASSEAGASEQQWAALAS